MKSNNSRIATSLETTPHSTESRSVRSRATTVSTRSFLCALTCALSLSIAGGLCAATQSVSGSIDQSYGSDNLMPYEPPNEPATPTPAEDSMTSSTQPTAKLEDDASAWTAVVSGSADWSKGNTANPSMDGKALRLSMSNATAGTEVTFLRETGARSNVASYTLTASFQVQDSRGAGSPLQKSVGLGFLRVDQGSTAEVMVRWKPMDETGLGMWYVYDPNVGGDGWRSLNIRSTLEANRYYTITFDANISCTQVSYRKLTVDTAVYQFNTSSGIWSSPGDPSRVAVEASLFADKAGDGYSLYMDGVSIAAKSSKSMVCSP